MTIAYSGDNITFPDSTVQATAPRVGMVNRIINGGMVVDQRNAGASVTVASTSPYTLDRWRAVASQSSKLTVQQNAASVMPPTGFTNYLGVTSSSAYSVLTGDYFLITQYIEGYNVSDLGFGATGASTVTISFWVRSSLTGTFGGSLSNNAENRSYPFNYTISVANTWEQKSVTIAGDTTGTWLTTTGRGLEVNFGLGCGATYSSTANAWAASWAGQPTGSVSVVGTSGATFYITGVQLEKGSTATDFDYRQYGQELALCQRYYWKMAIAAVYQSVVLRPDWSRVFYILFKQTMRAAPTATYTYDADGAGVTAGTPALSTDYFRMGTSASSTAGADPRLTAFDVSAEL